MEENKEGRGSLWRLGIKSPMIKDIDATIPKVTIPTWKLGRIARKEKEPPSCKEGRGIW
jgi:hypothetical protein